MVYNIALALAFGSVFFLALSIAHPFSFRREVISPSQVLSIAPNSGTCDSAPQPSQCRTADQVAPLLNRVFNMYQIASPGEMAAIASLVAFESTDFKYNRNYFPGIPGQGTRNMQSAAFNLVYAQSIPALSASVAGESTAPNEVLDLLTMNDEYDFGSAAWYLSTQCSESIRDGLQNGSPASWQAYISGCVGTTPTPDRQAYWQRAAQAFGATS